MQKGISVWLDVPLEALARRIAAIGTDSRPLLHQSDSSDAYTKVVFLSCIIINCLCFGFGITMINVNLSLNSWCVFYPSTFLQALNRLSTLWEERGESYANANARVSLESKYASAPQLNFPFNICIDFLQG